jgi:riboflavin kinase / FMN adenylyltransferase
MELIRGFQGLKSRHHGSVATIGNFDGVHLGHQEVLRELTAGARELKLPATVVVFEPMALEYFARNQPPARLTRFGEKWRLLAAAGVEHLLCLRFDRLLAEMPAESFVERVLVQGLGVRHLTVGDDFRFGRDRRGDFAMLQQAGRAHGFEVADTASLELDGERVSSSRIRALLMKGDMQGAARLLGRPYSLSGRVMYGERLGRKLGFPTANLALRRKLAPVGGIFAARVLGLGPEPKDAAAYVGTRPALGGTQPVLETHLLDFSGDFYGRKITVELLQHLREDRHFDSLDALTAQMRLDVQAAQAWLAAHRT